MQLTFRLATFSNRLPWRSIAPWLVPIGLVLLWQILAQAGVIATRILPAPTQVAEAAIRLTQSGELFRNVMISLWRAGIGFLIGGSIGLVLGLD
jgi:sulfonate transport system permease protein